MGSSKKSKPKYAETTYDTGGLFGSSTSNKEGTTYSPTNWISSTMGTVTGNLGNTINNMLSNDYANDANFQVYQNQLNKTAAQNYDASVLSALADRGLMRSSGLQSATNSFANTLADNTTDLYDSYYNRQTNNLSNLLNTSNAIYNYITGVNSGALGNTGAVNSFNQANAGIKNPNSDLWATLANAASNIGGQVASAMLKK